MTKTVTMPLQSSSFSSEVSTHIKALFYEFELKTELSNQEKKNAGNGEVWTTTETTTI